MATKEEINKYLTEELFGECWHEKGKVAGDGVLTTFSIQCKHCNKEMVTLNNNDFFTWEGFGKLWEKVQTQKWIYTFVYHKMPFTKEIMAVSGPSMIVYDINPERFATAVYEFLKENN
jgi:hypothetical protein